MKILLIYTEDDLKEEFEHLPEEVDISVENFQINSLEGERANLEKQFFSFFRKPNSTDKSYTQPTHVLIHSALEPGWIDFFAGFSCGCQIPFIVYGEDAVKCIPEVYNFCFTLINAENELQDYLINEYKSHYNIISPEGSSSARETLLEMGIPVNEKSMADCVNERHTKEVSLFLEAGFSPDTKDKNGVPLLNLCARKGDAKTLQLLLQAGADVNQLAEDRNSTAVFDAALGNHQKLVKILIEAGVDVNIQSKDGQTALIVAAGSSYHEIAEMLVKAGADPDLTDSLGASARSYAELFGRSEMLELFGEGKAEK